MRNPIQQIRDFYHSTTVELKKCTWPTWSELTESTAVVVISVLLLSLFVALSDWGSQLLIRFVTVTL